MRDLIIISIKENYVNLILSGKKTIELRKVVPRALPGDIIMIYTTQPKKAITAIAYVKRVFTCPPEDMWRDHHMVLGISKLGFDKYYKERKKAVGIEFSEVFKLESEISLSAIKLIYPKFSPPQTYKYIFRFSTLRNFRGLFRVMISKANHR